jgi:hypothetical protein
LERKEICSDILEKVKEDGDFLHSVVTCSWNLAVSIQPRDQTTMNINPLFKAKESKNINIENQDVPHHFTRSWRNCYGWVCPTQSDHKLEVLLWAWEPW